MAFDPSKFGAIPVNTTGGFDPSKFGATPVETPSITKPTLPGTDVAEAGVAYAKDWLQRSANLFKDTPSDIATNVKTAADTLNEPATAVNTFVKKPAALGQVVARSVISPIVTAGEALFMPVGDFVHYVSDKTADLPAVQRFAMGDTVSKLLDRVKTGTETLDQISKDHPEIAPDIKNAVNLALLLAAPKGAKTATEAAAPVVKTAGEAVATVAKGTAQAAADAGSSLAKTIDDSAGILKAPFAKSYKPDVAAAFERQGVEAPVSAVTASKAVQTAEANAGSSVFGGGVTATIENARKAIFEITNSLRKEVNPEKLITAGATPEAAGNAVKDAVAAVKKTFNETKGKLYDEASKKIGQQQADLTETKNALKDIIEQKSASLDPTTKAQARFYQQILNATGTAEKRTFNTIKQTRTDIGRKIGNRADPISTGDSANLKRLYGALSDDLDATVGQSGHEAQVALKAANDYYKAGVASINSMVGRTIFNSKSPELIIGKLVKAGDVSTIREMKSLVGEEAFHTVSSAFMNKLVADVIVPLTGKISASKISTILAKYGDDFLREILGERGLSELKDLRKAAIVEDILDRGTKEGKVMPSALEHAINSYDKKVLEEAFTPEELAKLRDVQTMSKGLAQGTKIADGSPTAEKIMGSVGFNLTLGIVSVKALIAKFAAQYGLSKLVTSKLGKRYLTSGFRRESQVKNAPSATTKETPSAMATGQLKSTSPKSISDMSESIPQADKSVKGDVYRYSEKPNKSAVTVTERNIDGEQKFVLEKTDASGKVVTQQTFSTKSEANMEAQSLREHDVKRSK